MPKRLRVESHLSVEELYQRYRYASHTVEARHYQTLWLLAQGQKAEEVASSVGYSLNWVYELVRSYNRMGPEMVGDQRQENQGKQPLLNDIQQAQLWQALQEPPADGGVWSGPKVANWMSELLGVRVHPQRGWEYLKGLRYRLRCPRPHHQKADEVEQKHWKKNCHRRRRNSNSSIPTPK